MFIDNAMSLHLHILKTTETSHHLIAGTMKVLLSIRIISVVTSACVLTVGLSIVLCTGSRSLLLVGYMCLHRGRD